MSVSLLKTDMVLLYGEASYMLIEGVGCLNLQRVIALAHVISKVINKYDVPPPLYFDLVLWGKPSIKLDNFRTNLKSFAEPTLENGTNPCLLAQNGEIDV